MSSTIHTLSVSDGAGERLDAYLAARMEGLTRSGVARLIDEELVTVNGAPEKAKYKVKIGDEITVEVPPPTRTAQPSTKIP